MAEEATGIAGSEEALERSRASSFWRRLRPWLIWACIGAAAFAYFRRMEPPPPKAPAELRDRPGVRLLYKYECGRCHRVSHLPGMDGKMGPSLDGLGSRLPKAGKREYLRRSLREPGRDVAKGYLNLMPSFEHLSAGEEEELLDYLSGLK